MRKTLMKSRCFVATARGFTLIEVMVVAVVVLLMLGMALPVFRAITGSHSEAGAANHITAMLSRARSDAIGLQKTIGVAFIYNASTQVTGMAEVEFPDCLAWAPNVAYNPGTYVSNPNSGASPYYYCATVQPGQVTFPGSTYWKNVGGPPLELRQDTDVLPLPTGIGVQTVCNCDINTSKNSRTSDGYLSFGVILFDGQGRITCQNYGVSQYSKLALASGLAVAGSSANMDYPVYLSPGIAYPATSTNYGVPSQFGLVVYQLEPFLALGNPVPTDLFYKEAIGSQTTDYPGSGLGKTEEDWLDLNATPLVLDRYTGTLIKGE